MGGLERDFELEVGAGAGRRLDPDASAHERDEALANGEAQTCAAVFAGGGGIDLGESEEEPVNAICRDADAGIADGDMEQGRRCGGSGGIQAA